MRAPAETPSPPVRAAQYLRMSKESQRYSIENQRAAIAIYAVAHGIEVVRSYSDAGISGVSIARRRGLQLSDVLTGAPDFTVILVYDVSRWGRFQNPQRMYKLYVHQRLSQGAIADILNQENIKAERGGLWRYNTVNHVLTSPKYVGDLVASRWRRALGGENQRTDPATWIRVPNAFEGIVPRKLFDAAQRRYAKRGRRRSRASVLEAAAAALATHGDLTDEIIAAAPDMPSRGSIRAHFGSLAGLCAELGHPYSGAVRRPRIEISAEEALLRLAALYAANGYLNADLIDRAPDVPSCGVYRRHFGPLWKAYALVGFVKPSRNLIKSPVGVARLAAARTQAVRLRSCFKPDPSAEDPGWTMP